MKRIVIEVPKDKSDKIRDKFKDTIYSVIKGEKSTRFILYVPDEMLDDLIHQTNGSVKDTQPSRPIWTGIIPDYESLAKDEERSILIEVSTPDFVISPFVDRLKEKLGYIKKKREDKHLSKRSLQRQNHRLNSTGRNSFWRRSPESWQ
ncbi:MAG TPA: hypothetical protein PLU94_01830 [Methanoregulaceae archaeon]|nr:hypothetical protein [Methanoregulaceae archaeon]HPM61327.1 hypothetical protein [Methanoregulaceae archaeon]